METTRALPTTVAAGLCLLIAAVSPVHAQSTSQDDDPRESADVSKEKKEEFTRLVGKGREAYEAGNYEEAVSFLEAAYAIIPHRNLRYRIALSHERAGNPAEALANYRKFLELEPEAELREEVEQRIARLEDARAASVRIDTNPSAATVLVRPADATDTEPRPRGKTPVEMETSPGRIAITLRKEGFAERTEVVEVRAESRNRFQWELDRPDRAQGTQTLPVVAAVVGGVGVLSGVTLYGIGRYCDGNRPSCRVGLYKTAAVGAYVAAGVGLVGLGTAGAIWLPGGGGDGGDSRAGLRLELRWTGRGLGIGGRF